MNSPMSDEQLERELRGYLDWEAGQVRRGPTSAEIIARISGTRSMTRPDRRLAMSLAVAGLCAVLGAGVFLGIRSQQPGQSGAGQSGSGQSGPAQSGPVASSPTTVPGDSAQPSGTPSASPAAACAANSYDVLPARADVSGPHKVPWGGLLAFAVSGYFSPPLIEAGKLEVTDGATGTTRIIAVTGSRLPLYADVHVAGWSADGRTLLVEFKDLGCDSEWLVQADGSGGLKLGDQPLWNDPGALSPDGTSVVYSTPWGLGFLRAGMPSQVIACASETTGPAWSPDGSRVVAVCGQQVTVFTLGDGLASPRGIWTIPDGEVAVALAWQSDGQILVAAASGANAPTSPTTIVAINPVDVTSPSVGQVAQVANWAEPGATFSPNGRWLLAENYASGSDVSEVVDTATGAVQKLPRTIGVGANVSISWLPDGNSFLYIDGTSLRQVTLNPLRDTAIEPFAVQSFLWHPALP
jgi:WD40-like Beta Propeller Repeat